MIVNWPGRVTATASASIDGSTPRRLSIEHNGEHVEGHHFPAGLRTLEVQVVVDVEAGDDITARAEQMEDGRWVEREAHLALRRVTRAALLGG